MPPDSPYVSINLPLDEAKALHSTLEQLLESGPPDPTLQKFYRALGWRILAVEGGTGLTAQISELAREANSLEEYETARDELLGPILDGLERGENRDP